MRYVVEIKDDLAYKIVNKVRGPFDTKAEAHAHAEGIDYARDDTIRDVLVVPFDPDKHVPLLRDWQYPDAHEKEDGNVFLGVEISTANITLQDAKILEKLAASRAFRAGAEDGGLGITVASYEYGFFLTLSQDYLQETLDGMKKIGLSPEFRHIVTHWTLQDKRLLWIDRDADVAEGLPTFDW